jgi:hypothetical protein
MKIVVAVWIACFLSVSSGLAQTGSPLVLKRKIVLNDVKGKLDHFAIDETGNRLFIAATGNKSVEVIDLATDKAVESLTGLGKPHGLAWVAGKGRLFVADGDKASLEVFEGAPLKLVKSIRLSEDADDMTYDSKTGMLYVGHGGSDSGNPASVAVVDVDRLMVAKQLTIAAHPEALELDAKGGRVFVNVSDTGEVAVIDTATQTKKEIWKLTDAKGNTPLAYDAENNVVLIGCRTPAQLIALSGGGKEISAATSDVGADDLFFEPKTGRAYLITGSGFVDIYLVAPDGKLKALAKTRTAAGAKTGLLVPGQSLLYIGVPGVNAPAEIDVYATGT